MTHLVYNNLLSNFPNVKSLLDNTLKMMKIKTFGVLLL